MAPVHSCSALRQRHGATGAMGAGPDRLISAGLVRASTRSECRRMLGRGPGERRRRSRRSPRVRADAAPGRARRHRWRRAGFPSCSARNCNTASGTLAGSRRSRVPVLVRRPRRTSTRRDHPERLPRRHGPRTALGMVLAPDEPTPSRDSRPFRRRPCWLLGGTATSIRPRTERLSEIGGPRPAARNPCGLASPRAPVVATDRGGRVRALRPHVLDPSHGQRTVPRAPA